MQEFAAGVPKLGQMVHVEVVDGETKEKATKDYAGRDLICCFSYDYFEERKEQGCPEAASLQKAISSGKNDQLVLGR